MAIYLNGLSLIPIPFVTIQVENEFKENGNIKKSSRIITLQGKILSNPNLGASESARLGIIQSQYSAIEAALTHKIGDIYITGSVSIPGISGKCKLKSKSFQVDAGNIYGEYTISLEQTINQPEEADETWSLDPADEYNRFVKVTRTRSLTLESTENATYQNAMSKVPGSSSVSDGAALLPSPIPISNGNAYNKTTSYSVNTEKNSVECTESWTISLEKAIVDDTFTVKESSETVHKSASRQISITGLEGGSGKYANAESKYNSIKKDWKVGNKETIGGVSGNIRTLSIGKNELAGTINVSMDISEGIEEEGQIFKSVEVTDNPPTDFYASIAAVGKPEGPILQKFGTKKQGTKTVSVNVIYSDGSYTIPDVGEYAPTEGAFFVDKDEVSYDERSGRVTRNVSWIYGGDFV